MPATPLIATDIIRDFRTGSSLPALVETGAGRFVVKWHGIGDGPVTSAVDWICLHLARALRIRVPRPVIVRVREELAEKAEDAELRDLVLASQGLDLGLEYLSGVEPYQSEDRERISKEERDRIFLLDLLVLNIDRIEINPNMLWSGDRLFCLDFSAALGVKALLDDRTYDPGKPLARLRRHPFYTDAPTGELSLGPDHRKDFQTAMEALPLEWINPDPGKAGEIRTGLAGRVIDLVEHNREIVPKRLARLKTIPLQTPAQARDQGRKNLEEFKRKAGLL